MIEIQENKIIRDGVDIGQIEGGTAYVTEKQPPRVVGQIRAAAGNPDLVIQVMGKEAPTVKESLQVEEQPEIGVTVEVPEEAMIAVSKLRQADAMLAEIKPKWNLSELPPVGDKAFARSFINIYGPDEYAQFQKSQAE